MKGPSCDAANHADFTRTCEGCKHVEASYLKDMPLYRCFAPGPYQGYMVGRKRFNPWVPAWCPEKPK